MSDDPSRTGELPEPKGQWFPFGLSGSLDAALWLYYDEMRDYYSRLLTRDGEGPLDRLAAIEAIAAGLYGDVEKLVAPGVTPLVDQLVRADEHAGKGSSAAGIAALLDSLRFHIGYKVVGMTAAAKERVMYLLLLLQDRQTSPKAMKFLARVSRCYLFGFDAECIVMCRAALDAHFQTEISNDDCVGVLGPRALRGPQTFDLADRIGVARAMGKIDQDTCDDAHRVRKDGNEVVHLAPNTPRSVNEVLADTLRVIEALQ